MQVSIQLPSGDVRQFSVQPTEQVQNLKSQLEQHLKYPTSAQKLMYEGRELSNEQEIASLGLHERR